MKEAKPHFTYIACDASWDPESKLAAVAACAPGRPLAGRVVPAECSSDAELQAILAAMDACAGERMRCVEFRCDAAGVVNAINGSRAAKGFALQVRRRLQIPPRNGVWKVQCVHRSDVQSAHRLAELIWNAFGAGRMSGRLNMEAVA